jgi:hypothetical protein
MLASSFITCNLECNPWRENKVLVPLLFFIGGFHFSHLYICLMASFVTSICTKLINGNGCYLL